MSFAGGKKCARRRGRVSGLPVPCREKGFSLFDGRPGEHPRGISRGLPACGGRTAPALRGNIATVRMTGKILGPAKARLAVCSAAAFVVPDSLCAVPMPHTVGECQGCHNGAELAPCPAVNPASASCALTSAVLVPGCRFRPHRNPTLTLCQRASSKRHYTGTARRSRHANMKATIPYCMITWTWSSCCAIPAGTRKSRCGSTMIRCTYSDRNKCMPCGCGAFAAARTSRCRWAVHGAFRHARWTDGTPCLSPAAGVECLSSHASGFLRGDDIIRDGGDFGLGGTAACGDGGGAFALAYASGGGGARIRRIGTMKAEERRCGKLFSGKIKTR